MAPTTTLRMTPLAALLNATLQAQRNVDLPTYLAIARTPGAGWKTYDEIVDDLTALSGRDLNRVSIKTYTEDTFKIPNTRYALVDGKQIKMPRTVNEGTLSDYIGTLDTAVVNINAVGDAAREAEAAIRAEAAAIAEAESNLPA